VFYSFFSDITNFKFITILPEHFANVQKVVDCCFNLIAILILLYGEAATEYLDFTFSDDNQSKAT